MQELLYSQTRAGKLIEQISDARLNTQEPHHLFQLVTYIIDIYIKGTWKQSKRFDFRVNL